MNKPRPFIVNNYYKPMVTDKIYVDDLYSQYGTMTYEEMKEKIQTNFNLNFRNEFGENLAFAVIKNETAEFTELQKLEIIKELSVRGVPLCSINQYNQTFLHEASKKGYYDIIKFYENNNCGLNTIDNYGNAPIHYAVDALVFNCDENNIIEDETTNKEEAYKIYNDAIEEVKKNSINLGKIKQIIENQKYFKVEELEKIIITSKKEYDKLKFNKINTNDFLIEVFNKFKKEYTYKNEKEILNDDTIEFELDKLKNLNSKYIINFDVKNDYVFGKFKLELTKYYNDNKINKYEFTENKFTMDVSNNNENFNIIKYVFLKFIEKYTNVISYDKGKIYIFDKFTNNEYIKKILTIDNDKYDSDEITKQITNNNQYKNNIQNNYIQNVIKVNIDALKINVDKLQQDIIEIKEFYKEIIANINNIISNIFTKSLNITDNLIKVNMENINKIIKNIIIEKNTTNKNNLIEQLKKILNIIVNKINTKYDLTKNEIMKNINEYCDINLQFKINTVRYDINKYNDVVINFIKLIDIFSSKKMYTNRLLDHFPGTKDAWRGKRN